MNALCEYHGRPNARAKHRYYYVLVCYFGVLLMFSI